MASDTEKVREIKDNLKYAEDATGKQYEDSIEDLKFLDGEGQWPTDLEADRAADGRPSLRINKLPGFLDRVVGDQRRNRPSIKVSPVDSEADIDTAKVFGGLIRNIEQQSGAQTAYSTAEDSMTACGLGAWRVVTEYSGDDTFDQDIKIKRIKNPFTVWYDPDAQELDRSDAEWCIVTESLTRDNYKKQYPKADPCEFDANRDDYEGWIAKDRIRIAEYLEKVYTKKKIYLIQRGDNPPEIVTDLPEDDLDAAPGETGYTVLKERIVDSYEIEWRRVNGKETIEGVERWAGKYIPIVMACGKELNIENSTSLRGIVRNAKDPTRLYNYSRSASAEKISLAPKSPYLATPKMIEGFETQWKLSMKRNFPYLYFNADKNVQGMFPKREPPIGVDTGIQAEIMIADQELHDTTGIQLAAMGKKSNEKSGIAIQERSKETDVGNVSFADNMAVAIRYTGKILVDLIPKIYDTARVVRILNEDDTQEQVKVNEEYEKESGKIAFYDVTVGKYDVAISTGPSYQTQRQESADGMVSFLTAVPDAAPMILDLVAKNMDWPGADEIAERLRKTIPPELTEETEDGQPQQPPGPPPEQQAAAESLMELEIETAEVKLAQEKADLRKKEAEANLAEAEASGEYVD